jgi:hypothetical protein
MMMMMMMMMMMGEEWKNKLEGRIKKYEWLRRGNNKYEIKRSVIMEREASVLARRQSFDGILIFIFSGVVCNYIYGTHVYTAYMSLHSRPGDKLSTQINRNSYVSTGNFYFRNNKVRKDLF